LPPSTDFLQACQEISRSYRRANARQWDSSAWNENDICEL